MLIWLAEIDALVLGTTPRAITLRVASSPVGYNHPSAAGLYLPYLKDVANIRRSLVAPSRTFGEAQTDVGTMTISNVDGELDAWFSYAYGRPARVLLGEHDAPYSSFTPIMTGIIEQSGGDRNSIAFKFKDASAVLDAPVSPAIYAGTNSGVTGREGGKKDIKGQHKITIYGKPRNVTPDPINVNNNIYALNHTLSGALAPIQSLNAVRFNGSAWAISGYDATMDALEAATVTVGEVRVCLSAAALKRGGGAITGTLTVDATTATSAAQNRVAAVAKALLMSAGIAESNIDVGSLDSDAPWEVGVVIHEETARAALNALLGESAIWYALNQHGVYQLRLVRAPTGNPVAAFKRFAYPEVAALGEYQIITLEPQFSSIKETSTPAWRVSVNYDRRFTVQDKDALAYAIGEEDKEYYSREYSTAAVEDAVIRTRHPNAEELTFNTLITNETHAIQLANHLFALYSIQRQIYSVTVHYDGEISALVDLGDVVKLIYPRYGLNQGKLGRIISMYYNAKSKTLEMEVWTWAHPC
jgi:hypothetical protein